MRFSTNQQSTRIFTSGSGNSPSSPRGKVGPTRLPCVLRGELSGREAGVSLTPRIAASILPVSCSESSSHSTHSLAGKADPLDYCALRGEAWAVGFSLIHSTPCSCLIFVSVQRRERVRETPTAIQISHFRSLYIFFSRIKPYVLYTSDYKLCNCGVYVFIYSLASVVYCILNFFHNVGKVNL